MNCALHAQRDSIERLVFPDDSTPPPQKQQIWRAELLRRWGKAQPGLNTSQTARA